MIILLRFQEINCCCGSLIKRVSHEGFFDEEMFFQLFKKDDPEHLYEAKYFQLKLFYIIKKYG